VRVGTCQAMIPPSTQLAALAISAGAFDWLADEPDLYDDASGEPV
jgi:hypothetical protein